MSSLKALDSQTFALGKQTHIRARRRLLSLKQSSILNYMTKFKRNFKKNVAAF